MLAKTVILLLLLCCTLSEDSDKNSLIEDIWGNGEDSVNDNSTTTTTSTSSPATITPRNPDFETTTSESCECVPYYLCKNGTINTDGENIIDIRMGECPHYLETCCGGAKITPTTPKPPTPPPKHVGCGYRNSIGVGFTIKHQIDNEAEYGEFPWMVAIFHQEAVQNINKKKLHLICGGALIHPEVVLTAAHCVKNKKVALTIRAGEWDTQTEKELYSYQDREVRSMVIHPQYYAAALYNDVALLFLKSPVELDQHINMACLPPEKTVVNNERCVSSGWGKDSFGKEGKYQAILKKVELPMVPKKKCEQNLRETRLGKRFQLHKSFVCAGGEAGIDTCKGDGGSPLLCPIEGQNGRYHQIGMVAWGIGCGGLNVPGVYVNVPLFRKWIDNEMKQRNYNISTYQY